MLVRIQFLNLLRLAVQVVQVEDQVAVAVAAGVEEVQVEEERVAVGNYEIIVDVRDFKNY
jgi:hypothetical protein